MKRLLYTLLVLSCIFIPGNYLFSGDPGEDDPPPETPPPKIDDDWVYGQIEYLHDVLSPYEYFLKLHDTPSNGLGVPDVYGGYQTTDVYTRVRLKGVQVPRAMHERDERNRPPNYIDRERQRWDDAMRTVWNIMEPTKTFKVANMEVLENDKLIEADIFVLKGGGWINLAMLLVNDHFVVVDAGVDIDFGGRGVAPTNPNIPK